MRCLRRIERALSSLYAFRWVRLGISFGSLSMAYSITAPRRRGPCGSGILQYPPGEARYVDNTVSTAATKACSSNGLRSRRGCADERSIKAASA